MDKIKIIAALALSCLAFPALAQNEVADTNKVFFEIGVNIGSPAMAILGGTPDVPHAGALIKIGKNDDFFRLSLDHHKQERFERNVLVRDPNKFDSTLHQDLLQKHYRAGIGWEHRFTGSSGIQKIIAIDLLYKYEEFGNSVTIASTRFDSIGDPVTTASYFDPKVYQNSIGISPTLGLNYNFSRHFSLATYVSFDFTIGRQHGNYFSAESQTLIPADGQVFTFQLNMPLTGLFLSYRF